MKFGFILGSFRGMLMTFILFLLVIIGCSGGDNPASSSVRSHNFPVSNNKVVINPGHAAGTQSVILSDRVDSNGSQWVEGEVLVVLKSDVSREQAAGAIKNYPLELKKEIKCRWATVYRLHITDNTPVMDMVRNLKANPLVRMAGPNYFYPFAEAPYVPNDPLWERDDPGDEPRDNVNDQWGPAMIGAPIVWNETKGASDVIVAVIDTGIRKDHEDLWERLWINEDEIPDNGIDDDQNGWIDDTWGWDCMDHDNDPYDDGYYASYHGTACSGVVAATQDNERGLSGVAPGIKVMALKVDLTGYGAFESTVIEGIEYARVNGAHIASMSFGNWTHSEILEAQCIDAWDNGNGMILMASAGNEDNTNIRYPSRFDSVLTVGASIPWTADGKPRDEARLSSNIGYYWGSCYGDKLVVMGFGDWYTTTHGMHYDSYWDGGVFDYYGGTSCACPMSAGVMALIKTFFPDKNGQWCWDRLKDTADDLHTPGFDDQTGYGRCNAIRAVYASDRFKNLEDPLGFVTLTLPDDQVFDTIHDVPGNPYYDIEDLYRAQMKDEGSLIINFDIYTLGENLEIAVYADEQLTQLLGSAIGENHAGSNTEELFINNLLAGQEVFIRVFSAGPGNSSTYSLKLHQGSNSIWVSGESLAPSFIHQKGEKIPFLKIKLEVGLEATLKELIINKHGTLPNDRWINAQLYKDSNSNQKFDGSDELVIEKFPQARNRVRLDGLNIKWNYHKPLYLFFTADFKQTLVESTVAFSLETYKDVSTVEGFEAPYDNFPVASDYLLVGTDSEPPVWATTKGVQTISASYKSAKLGWNKAVDALTPPVKYNIYHTDILPFNINTATKIANVSPVNGTGTDYEYSVYGLPGDIQRHFVVRAEDQAGNEDDNLVILSCTPGSGGDPANPKILTYYSLLDPEKVEVYGDKLVVADSWNGLVIFDRTNPVDLVQKGKWSGDAVYSVNCDGHYAYCGGYNNFSVIDLTNPSYPVLADYLTFWDGYTLGRLNNWVYVVSTYNNAVLTVEVGNPYDIKPKGQVPIQAGYHHDMVVLNDYIYIASYYIGVQVLSRVTPDVPSLKGNFGPVYASGIEPVKNALLVASGNTLTLEIYNIEANPTSPPKLSSLTYPLGGNPTGIAIVGNYAYVSDSTNGIFTFDVSNLSDIKYVGSLSLPNIRDLATDGVVIYAVGWNASSGQGRLWVIV